MSVVIYLLIGRSFRLVLSMLFWRELIPVQFRGFRRRITRFVRREPGPREISFDPEDCEMRQNLSDAAFRVLEKGETLGTIGRGRLILRIIEEGYPSANLEAAYFENLEFMFKDRKRRESPGQIILGLGTGRCGSTSFSALLGTIENSLCTHENPPLIFWTPKIEQLQFHVKRFNFLAQYFSVVADVSHWWLNAIDNVLEFLPNCKAIGIHREIHDCARSFMRTCGYGFGSRNHWAPYENNIWAHHLWDPTYPTFPVETGASKDPDRIKYELIKRYIFEYNAHLEEMATRAPKRVMLIRSNELNDPTTQTRIFEFVGMFGRVSSVNLNVGTVSDGEAANLKF